MRNLNFACSNRLKSVLLLFFFTLLFSALSGVDLWAGEVDSKESSEKDEKKHKIKQLPSLDVSPPPVLNSPNLRGRKFEDRFLNLGADTSFDILERDLIKAQVKSFIPPALVPAVGNHAFVLPPGLFQVATSFKFVNVVNDDFQVNGKINPLHQDNSVQIRFLTTSLRYGFDLDKKFFHSFTAVLNIVYESSVSRGAATFPNKGIGGRSVFNGGTSEGLQDLNLMIKKKIWDQGNMPIGWAVAAGVYFPSGSSNQRAGDNGVVSVVNNATGGVARPVFKRFNNTGALPAGRQLGTGEMSYKVGTFFTRQLLPGDMPSFLAGTRFDRAAIHWGGTYRFNLEHNGVNRGDLATIFGSLVVPVFRDYVSFQVASVTKWQENDTYTGNFTVPNTGVVTPRPDFRGGWLSLFGPSIIFSPDPLIRLTATILKRVLQPNLGPSPSFVANIGASFVF